MVVTDGLEEIDEDDPSPLPGTEGFGDQPVAVEPAPGICSADPEHPVGLGDGQERAKQATLGSIDVAVELHVAYVGMAAAEVTAPSYYARSRELERTFDPLSM